MKTFILATLIFLMTPIAQAKNFSLFAGTGIGYGWPETYKVSWKNIELGEYSSSLGVVKLFPKNDVYASFGAGISRQGDPSPGFIGTVGWHKIWGLFGLRIDWSTFAATNSYMSSDVTVGLTLNF